MAASSSQKQSPNWWRDEMAIGTIRMQEMPRATGQQPSPASLFKLVLWGIALLLFVIVGLTIMFGSWYTIDQTQRGVLLRNGAFVGVVQPGLNFKWPWIETVYKIDMQTH